MPLKTIIRLGILLGGVVYPALGQAEITVTSAAELRAALAQVDKAETILLAPGEYGRLELTGPNQGDAEIILRSADPQSPARFSEMALSNAANLTFDTLTFDYTFQMGDPVWTAPFVIRDSHNITIQNSIFDGDLARGISEADDGFGTGIGLSVYNSSMAGIDRNLISNFYRGLVVSSCDQVRVTGNDVHSIRSDGMNFVATQTLLVEANHIHDFKASRTSGDHADMIQFWTAGTTRPSTDIVIRDNVLNSGNGNWSQSILIGNELVTQGKAGTEMFYRNISITGNVIINSHLHGITVSETDGLEITNNTVIHNRRTDGETDNPKLWTPRINVSSIARNVTISANVTSAIFGPEKQPDWKVSNNLLIQDYDPAAPGYYNDVFVAALYGDPQTLAPFTYLPGGPADGVRIGAARLLAPMPPDQVVPLAQVQRDAQILNLFNFDARLSSGPGKLKDARYFWSFGDGSHAEGPLVTHVFAKPGRYNTTLTVQPAKGAAATASTAISIPAPDLLHFDTASGTLLVQRDNSMAALPDFPVVARPGEAGFAIPLGMGQKAPLINQSLIPGFFNAQDFDLELLLKQAPTQNPAGEILRIHTNLLLSWQPSGGLQFSLATADAKPVEIRTGPLRFEKDVWHKIRIGYDAATGVMWLEFDGVLRAKGKSAGLLKPDEGRGLSIGNPFGHKSFDGFLGGLDLRSNVNAFAKPTP